MRLNAFQLKIFAMVLMVIDHVYTYIPGMPMWMHHPGRIVAPIFFYFVVEGFSIHEIVKSMLRVCLYGQRLCLRVQH